jgi:hypothetical protein
MEECTSGYGGAKTLILDVWAMRQRVALNSSSDDAANSETGTQSICLGCG